MQCNKVYDTGLQKWEYGQETDFHIGKPQPNFLGPCPLCGNPTFNHSTGWCCINPRCSNGITGPTSAVIVTPDWWNTDINVKKDGNAWCAFYDDFVNLQESPAGFGDTPQEAVNALKMLEGRLIPHKHLPMDLLSAAPETCPECGVKHHPEAPHNRDSLFYQYYFYNKHGRWPTWEDAIAHCSEEIKQATREILKEHGIESDKI
jgi:hypothetical protein